MITIKQSGKIQIPQEDGFIGYAGDNLNKTIEFTLLDRADADLYYRAYLEFDDGSVNFFILDKKIQDGNTLLTWNVAQEQIYKDGIVYLQIKAFNTSGEAFHTEAAPIFVGRSVEFCNYLKERSFSEIIEAERSLNQLCADIESAKRFLPYIGDNGNWFAYDYESREFKDTGIETRCTLSNYSVTEEVSQASDNTQIPTAGAVYSCCRELENSVNLITGDLSDLETEDKASLVNAVNGMNRGKADRTSVYSAAELHALFTEPGYSAIYSADGSLLKKTTGTLGVATLAHVNAVVAFIGSHISTVNSPVFTVSNNIKTVIIDNSQDGITVNEANLYLPEGARIIYLGTNNTVRNCVRALYSMPT